MRPSPLQMLSGMLIATLITPVGLVHAAEGAAAPAGAAPGILASAAHAAQVLAVRAREPPIDRAAPTPRTLPRTGRTSKQLSAGGGSMAMVMSLVTAGAGVAGSYFVYRALKDQDDAARPADR